MKALAIVLLTAAWGQAQENAVEVLQRASEAYKNAKTYHFESVRQASISSDLHHSWSESFETLAAIVPENKVRFESREHTGWYVVVSDWRRGYLYRFVTNYMRGFEILGQPIVFCCGKFHPAQCHFRFRTSPFCLKQGTGHGRSGILSRVWNRSPHCFSIDCVVVRGEYDAPRGSVGIKAVTKTYWIDKARFLVLREENVTQGNLSPMTPSLEMEIRSLVKYTVATVNQPPPESLFTHVAPAGFRAMNTLERAFPRPTLDLIGKPAPDLTLSTLDGRQMPLSSLRGKVVLLDFWATWCAPCRDQMPAIAKLVKETLGGHPKPANDGRLKTGQ